MWCDTLWLVAALNWVMEGINVTVHTIIEDFSGGTSVKNLPANAGDIRDAGLILGSGRFPGGGNGNLL